MGSGLLVAEGLFKSYPDSEVLKGASLKLTSGDFVALLGTSGSGKSTFLHCLGLLEAPDRGSLEFDGQKLLDLSRSDAARFRLSKLGFVFQFHHLIPELNALENVVLPASLLGQRSVSESEKQARELLDWVGLKDKLHRFPWQLSGGEQQRVAVARALVNQPQLLLTDEATGNLDRARAFEVLELLTRVNRELGTTVLSVTHDEELARHYLRQYRLKDGQICDWVERPGS